jgi:molybdopterin-biosynthesis enzyme MoeA-like protein
LEHALSKQQETEHRKKPQAAVLTIGNEILCADVHDFNGCWLARELYQLGVEVGIMLTLPDEEATVAAHVRGLARRYAPLIITGGIGATLDDITRQAVAGATRRPLELRQDVVAALEKAKGAPLTETQKRFAELPRGCRLIPNRIGRAPGFIIDEIYVFPGVPEMLHDMFPLVSEEFRREPFRSRVLNTSVFESEIATLLEEMSRGYPAVRIGSYPKKDGERHYVEIVLKSKNEPELEKAFSWLADRLPGQPAA